MGYLWKDGKKIENGILGGVLGKIWFVDLWKIGGVVMWLGGIYDLDIGLLFFGMGNFVLWNFYLCLGDNYFLLLCLVIDFNIGKIVWYF